MKQRAWPASHLSNCSVCQSKRVLSLHTDDFMLFFSSSPISPHHSVYLFFGEPCTICHLSLIIAFSTSLCLLSGFVNIETAVVQMVTVCLWRLYLLLYVYSQLHILGYAPAAATAPHVLDIDQWSVKSSVSLSLFLADFIGFVNPDNNPIVSFSITLHRESAGLYCVYFVIWTDTVY